MKKAKLYLCHWDLLKNVECSLRLHVLALDFRNSKLLCYSSHLS